MEYPTNLICVMLGRQDISNDCAIHVSPQLDNVVMAAAYQGCTRFITMFTNPAETVFASKVINRRQQVEVWIINKRQLIQILKDPHAKSLLRFCKVRRKAMTMQELRAWCSAHADYFITLEGNNCPYVTMETLTNRRQLGYNKNSGQTPTICQSKGRIRHEGFLSHDHCGAQARTAPVQIERFPENRCVRHLRRR